MNKDEASKIIANLEKKIKGLQVVRQYELVKAARYKRAIDSVLYYEMDQYSDEVIEIKNILLESLKGGE